VRRTLPPLNPLRSFEAAARHQNYTLAARELSVTQVAVSRQVRVLEEYLEIPLFERSLSSLTLTPAGRTLLAALTPALDQIEHAVSAINKRGRRNVLSIQVYTAFAQRWFIPRLVEFRRQHPHIEINLRTADQDLNFDRHDIDAAIISAVTPPAEHDCQLLAGRDLLTVCAPSLLGPLKPPLGPEALRKLTLLHSLARPESWREWLDGAGYASVDARQGLHFETSSMVLGAAVAGMGVAVAARMLVEDELRSGVLVVPFEYVHRSPRQYYLVRPKSDHPKDALTLFSHWLVCEARA
jgi:LysR family glycine cleavage system transcriptional activator